MNSYSASESGSRLYIFDAATSRFGFVGLWAMCGSECERKPLPGSLASALSRPAGLSTSAGNLLRKKNAAPPVKWALVTLK